MKTFLIILAGIAAGALTFFLLSKYNIILSPRVSTNLTPTPYASTSPSETPIPTQTPILDETTNLKIAIKLALVAEHGPDSENLNITVSKIEDNYASGGASAQGGGGMWLAAKVGTDWKLVWDGNGTIYCSNLAPYPDFPIDLASECWDTSSQKLIQR